MNDFVTFVLNGEIVTVRDTAPTMTLLNYLRRDQRLTGTKEGCAEGDCGACTVAVGELIGDKVRYSAVNACIQFLPMLEGKAVVTVEALEDLSGRLHPAQQAMVDTHGSQCGFCTPGFVMSLYAAYLGDHKPTPNQFNDIFAGNLCRCTGYSPIIAAAEEMYSHDRPEWDDNRRAIELEQLKEIAHENTVALDHGGQKCFSPANINELARIYAEHPDAVIVAGATDVALWVTKQHRTLETIIHIGRVKELNEISLTDDLITIGAGVTYSDAEEKIAGVYRDLGELVRRLSAVQVRNAGTIGGNIANGSPIGDMPPALIALDAVLVLRRGADQRRIPLEAFFIEYGRQDRAPGEFVQAVEVPRIDDPDRLRCYKITKRFDQDISAVCGCFNIKVISGEVVDARICYGGMAGTPLRARAVEKALTGRPWSLDTINAALPAFDQDYSPLTDMRGSAGYRQQVAKNLLVKYFNETQLPLSMTRLVGRGATVAASA